MPTAAAKERYLGTVSAHRKRDMAGTKCAVCGGPLEAGFMATTNGSGLFWSNQANSARFRPKGLEVLSLIHI